jgi:TRAP-type C4-dicarboxylate transport system permease small subunit
VFAPACASLASCALREHGPTPARAWTGALRREVSDDQQALFFRARGQTMSKLKRLDEAWASVEAAVAVGMLLLMLVMAFAQALLRNLTQLGVSWANTALEELGFADFILSKGTLWLAFLGASLAVRGDKHIAIDIVPRLVSPKARMIMRSLVGFISCAISLGLSRAFWMAVIINGQERPPEFELLTSSGAVHICDASAAQLAEVSASWPWFFCTIRSVLGALGAAVDTPGAAFQLIVPVMFVIMAVRMFAKGVEHAIRVKNGDFADDLASHGLTGAASEVAHDLRDKGEG